MQPAASILLPTLNPGPEIEDVLGSIFQQRSSVPFEVLIVDSGSSPDDLRRMGHFPIRLQHIRSNEFGHGVTRNLLAQQAKGDALIFLTQDAKPACPGWLEALTSAIDEPRVAGAYSRQVPRDEADPFVSFFLAQMYGLEPVRIRCAPANGLPPGSILFSNVGSAIRRDVWERVPFRNVTMSEDQYWALDVLRAGYELAYQPAARVIHSHNYSLATLFRRNWLSGSSLRGLMAGSARGATAQGTMYLARESAFLLRKHMSGCLPRMLVYEAVRVTAFWLGLRFGTAE